jgi:uncharacterized damage-inducible protein DinB
VNKRLCFVFAALMAVPVALLGQEKSQAQAAPPANPITASEKGFYSFVSNAVVGAAQKMPEENYSFKPTREVRGFGQLVGHVADASYMFCSQAIGEANPAKDIEKTKTSKAALVAALKDGVAYCNKAFDSMTDAKGSQMVKFFNFDMAKLTLFSLNTAHTDEHYGNMVTYLHSRGLCRRQVKTRPDRRRSKTLKAPNSVTVQMKSPCPSREFRLPYLRAPARGQRNFSQTTGNKLPKPDGSDGVFEVKS